MPISKIWEHRKQILEGLKNTVIKDEFVEQVAEVRLEICKGCIAYDTSGEGCAVPGTQPCCSKLKEGCGCSLKIKSRALSSSCPLGKWDAILYQD